MAVAASPAAMANRTVTSCSRFLTLRLNPSLLDSRFWFFVNKTALVNFEGILTADDVISKWGWFNSGRDPAFGSCRSDRSRVGLHDQLPTLFGLTAPFENQTTAPPPLVEGGSGAFRGCLPRFRPLLLYYIHAYTSLHTSLKEMKQFLDLLGSPFVYRSPTGLQGFRAGLLQLTHKKLRPLAGTNSHYSKAVMVSRIIADMK